MHTLLDNHMVGENGGEAEVDLLCERVHDSGQEDDASDDCPFDTHHKHFIHFSYERLKNFSH